MRKCKIDVAVDELNARKGLTYPMIGHLRYSNIVGDGRNYRTLYVIINEGGGITYSDLNARTPRKTLEKLRAALNAPQDNPRNPTDSPSAWGCRVAR